MTTELTYLALTLILALVQIFLPAGAPRDIVVLNAGVALYAANVAPTMQVGVTQARAALAWARRLSPALTLEEVSQTHGRHAGKCLALLWEPVGP